MPDAIGRALNVREKPGQTLVDTLKVSIKDKHILLLLDNFEHLLVAAPIVSELLSACERLKVLVTSREGLHIYGEHEYNVPPLSVPDAEARESLARISKFESVQLFQQRAASIKAGFDITDQDIDAVADICIRLDGLPLAIELAAAGSKLFSPHMLRERLESRLNALARGGRDLPARLQTLRGTLDWSYELLEDEERTLLARLSVFRGGSTLEGIEFVCAPGLSLELMAGLESLVNKNLIYPKEEIRGELRFYMLETIREYAFEKLEQGGEIEEIKSQHAEYFSDLAVRSEPELFRANQEYWLERLRSDYSNLRAALVWTLGGESVTTGAIIVGALWEFWYHEGLFIDGMRWVQRTLTRESEIPTGIKAKVLNAASKMSFALGDYDAGKEYGWEGLDLAQHSGDTLTHAWIITTLCTNLAAFEEQRQLSVELLEEAIALFEVAGDEAGKARSYLYFGELNRALGKYDQAKEGYDRCLMINRRIGNNREIGMPIANLSYVAMHRKNYKQAEKLACEGLGILAEFMSKYYMAIGLAMLAGPLAAQKYPERAAVLMGASNGILDTLGACQQPGDQIEFDRYIDIIRAQLDDDKYEQALAKGAAMSFEEALDYALAGMEGNV